MKVQLETIPVWDALKAGGECFLCDLKAESEADAVRFYLGPSVMNPETRVKVNENGFCPRHFEALIAAGKPQGLGLMAETYLEADRAAWKASLEGLLSAKAGRKLDKAVEGVRQSGRVPRPPLPDLPPDRGAGGPVPVHHGQSVRVGPGIPRRPCPFQRVLHPPFPTAPHHFPRRALSRRPRLVRPSDHPGGDGQPHQTAGRGDLDDGEVQDGELRQTVERVRGCPEAGRSEACRSCKGIC
ncbi:MAG: DUF6062 family protein [Sphaerochaeta sp.]|nr:DUF6062 family protein [Sphaerochaeta sp.]